MTLSPKTKKNLIWLGILTIVWPFIQVVVFGLYNQSWAITRIFRSWPFLLVGLISGSVLLLLLHTAEEKKVRVWTIVAYIVGSPFALFSGILASKLSSTTFGPAIFGAITLLVFTIAGYIIGLRMSK